MFNTPILFLVFKRPDTTERVFEQIRSIRPAFLYLAADGPRNDKSGEKETCKKVREIVLSNIDWECEVNTLFRDENLGCGKAVSQAITWFFEHEEEGIILEDDCLPDASFFQYCAELLKKYRTEEKVMTISGSNLLGYPWKVNGQSYFWGQGGIWGWATWKRAWSLYDFKMQRWEEDKIKRQIQQ
jgi:threonyl-tRNA synthetase